MNDRHPDLGPDDLPVINLPTPQEPIPSSPPPTALSEVDLYRLQIAQLRLRDNERDIKDLVRQHTDATKAREVLTARMNALSIELRERYDLATATVDADTGAITRG